MLVALAVGLTTGSGLFVFASVSTVFVIGVLWILESLEPGARSRFDLKIVARNAATLRPQIEHALDYKGVTALREKITKLSKLIRGLDERSGASVEWEIKNTKRFARKKGAGPWG